MVENTDLVRKIIEKAVLETEDGPYCEVLARINFLRGFDMAVYADNVHELANIFHRRVVSNQPGVSWLPKREALEGAKAAINLGLSDLVLEEVDAVENRYKKLYSQREMREINKLVTL